MDKKILCALLILYVAFLVGCGGGPGNMKVDDDYRTGTGTVELSFESATTSTLYEGDAGVILVRAKNAGAYSLKTGTVVLSVDDSMLYLGTSQQYADGASSVNTKKLVKYSDRPLYGKTAISPTGDQVILDFPLYALKLPVESQQRSSKVVALACFPYETFQTNNVCVDVDPYRLKTSDKIKNVCESKDISFKAGGGPINVQTAEVRFDASEDGAIQPTFYFAVSASGSGFSNMKFFAPGDEQSFCDSRIRADAVDSDLIHFKATLSDVALDCNVANLVPGFSDTYAIQLYDGKARVSCTTYGPLSFAGDIVGNYYAPLTVNISYGVITTASKNIQVNALRK